MIVNKTNDVSRLADSTVCAKNPKNLKTFVTAPHNLFTQNNKTADALKKHVVVGTLNQISNTTYPCWTNHHTKSNTN